MVRSSIFAIIRQSPAFLKPVPLPTEMESDAVGSLGCTLIVIAMGWLFVLGFTVALAFNLGSPLVLLLFIAGLIANIALAITVVVLIRRWLQSKIQAFPVIVVQAKREHSESDSGPNDMYWLVLEHEDGSQTEHHVHVALFLKTVPPCAGVAHLHSYEWQLVHYDPVLTAQQISQT